MKEENDSLITCEECLKIKEKMEKDDPLSLLEAGLYSDHLKTCKICQREAKKEQDKK